MAANRFDIPEGRENAISRETLARLWRCTERGVRATIAEFRAVEAKDVILSSASGKPGYWRSTDADEIAGFIKETESRAKNTFLSVRAARRFLNRHKLQVPLDIDDTGEGA